MNRKRAFDLLLVLLALPIVLPVFLVTSGAVFIAMGRPLIFSQKRGGYQGQVFELKKFRSMTNQRDEDGKLLPDAQRITRFGRFLRSSSLDELPCLINLIRGDITLVGPRPFISDYLPLYSEEQRRRHEVVPGITGMAQVMGRNSISWEEKFSYDVWYVEHSSFTLDMKILLQTFLNVIRRRDINSDAHATMPLFSGSGSGDAEQEKESSL